MGVEDYILAVLLVLILLFNLGRLETMELKEQLQFKGQLEM